jgi:glycosyltransferase involved in cell wall biosynthesis
VKICFTLEGNYPYVRGGVSTWVDRFIRSLPQHEFVLWTIGDLESKRSQFLYELPENVTGVHENFLGSSLSLRISRNPNLKFSTAEKEAISRLIRCQEPDWAVLLDMFHLQPSKPVEFFLSEQFLGMLKEFARERFPFASFSELFWTVRSMFLPLLFLAGQPMPEADLYHSPSTGYAGVVAALAAMKYNKPFVLTEHGIYTREREEELLRSNWVAPHFKEYWISMFFMFSKFAYQQANRVTGLYHRASLIQQELGCPAEKCDVVRNGLDFDLYSVTPDKPANGWVDIAAIVRFAQIKDIKTMIYSFSRLKQDFEPVRLHILGGVDDEEYYRECVDLIQYLGIQDIILPGNVNVRSYLGNIDFTILTSISEGQPFAVIESMAARRPVIATDVGSCRELIEGDAGDNLGKAGICVPPMHQSKLLQAMLQLCQDNVLRKSMGLAGEQRIKQYYEIGGVMNNYLRVYEKAMATWQESVSN